MPNILIIDDEETLRKLLARLIGLEQADWEVVEAATAKTAWQQLDRQPVYLVLCDVRLPDANGVELSQAIKQRYPLLEVILLTAYGNIPDSVQAIKNGAFDYLVKGDDNNRLIPLLHRALEKVNLQRQVEQLRQRLDHRYGFDRIVGTSPAIEQARNLAKKVAPTDATVLLLGETGTGKEVFANAIHAGGRRAKGSFVAVNCSALSRELLESELFGYKAGAFTGAQKDKKGLLEEAHQGTLFLDEIGEMPLPLQAKLLRFLETGDFIKVGDTKTTRVDVRIIAATHRPLAEEAEAGRFRLDLFYRLSVFQIELPPLRERQQDIPLLTEQFIQHFALQLNHFPPPQPTNEYLSALQRAPWKGNIRELRNAIERSLILCEGDALTLSYITLRTSICAHQLG